MVLETVAQLNAGRGLAKGLGWFEGHPLVSSEKDQKYQAIRFIGKNTSYDVLMRTTLTIDDDLAAQIEELRRRKGPSMKNAVNTLLREGLKQQIKYHPHSRWFEVVPPGGTMSGEGPTGAV